MDNQEVPTTEKKEMITDEMIIAEWKAMLKMFHSITENNPKPQAVKESLLELKEAAKISARLTPKQVDGIMGRCDHYIAGTYGSTARAAH